MKLLLKDQHHNPVVGYIGCEPSHLRTCRLRGCRPGEYHSSTVMFVAKQLMLFVQFTNCIIMKLLLKDQHHNPVVGYIGCESSHLRTCRLRGCRPGEYHSSNVMFVAKQLTQRKVILFSVMMTAYDGFMASVRVFPLNNTRE